MPMLSAIGAGASAYKLLADGTSLQTHFRPACSGMTLQAFLLGHKLLIHFPQGR